MSAWTVVQTMHNTRIPGVAKLPPAAQSLTYRLRPGHSLTRALTVLWSPTLQRKCMLGSVTLPEAAVADQAEHRYSLELSQHLHLHTGCTLQAHHLQHAVVLPGPEFMHHWRPTCQHEPKHASCSDIMLFSYRARANLQGAVGLPRTRAGAEAGPQVAGGPLQAGVLGEQEGAGAKLDGCTMQLHQQVAYVFAMCLCGLMHGWCRDKGADQSWTAVLWALKGM